MRVGPDDQFQICSLIWPDRNGLSLAAPHLYIYFRFKSADVCAFSLLPYLCVRNADVFNVFSTTEQSREVWSQNSSHWTSHEGFSSSLSAATNCIQCNALEISWLVSLYIHVSTYLWVAEFCIISATATWTTAKPQKQLKWTRNRAEEKPSRWENWVKAARNRVPDWICPDLIGNLLAEVADNYAPEKGQLKLQFLNKFTQLQRDSNAY